MLVKTDRRGYYDGQSTGNIGHTGRRQTKQNTTQKTNKIITPYPKTD